MIFCRHKWKKVDETYIDKDISNGWKHEWTHWVRIKVVLVQCVSCGKLKKVKLR